MAKKSIILSGIQPSGQLTIGNYVGAIQPWAKLQHDYDCLFLLVDLHTLTVRQDPVLLRERCYDFLSLYIACGIDPDKNTLFVQSHVPAHTQLAWILNCYASLGELNRMTQFKEKSEKHKTNVNAGLFTYPVLQAADILLYNTNLVPVGEDQRQHLELARNLAIRFNNVYGDIFTVPELYFPPVGGRVMGLQYPDNKMSKSDTNTNNYIALLDPPDVARKKVMRSVTDSGSEIAYLEDKPGVSNLLSILSALTGKKIPDLENYYKDKGYGEFKKDVAEAVAECLTPIQERYAKIRKDTQQLQAILKRGSAQAQERAQPIVDRVYEAVGLIAR